MDALSGSPKSEDSPESKLEKEVSLISSQYLNLSAGPPSQRIDQNQLEKEVNLISSQ